MTKPNLRYATKECPNCDRNETRIELARNHVASLAAAEKMLKITVTDLQVKNAALLAALKEVLREAHIDDMAYVLERASAAVAQAEGEGK